jgi:hypothetical protein
MNARRREGEVDLRDLWMGVVGRREMLLNMLPDPGGNAACDTRLSDSQQAAGRRFRAPLGTSCEALERHR